jgi:hypothetical protein
MVEPVTAQPDDAERGSIADYLAGATSDWPDRAVDTVDLVVNTINDRALRPLIVAARAVVFGIVIAVCALVIGIVLSITLLRILDVYAFSGRVWASYLLLGGLFTLGGGALWTLRTRRAR